MEGLTRLVSESLARHGFDRPVDYRRLHWSRWFRCESPHSLLLVPSKPGVFAVAEEIVEFSPGEIQPGTAALSQAAAPRSAGFVWERLSDRLRSGAASLDLAGKTTPAPRRMLAVTRFFEDDDMAFVLDRMLAHKNPMRARLNSGRYFVRFVVIEDGSQRRMICGAFNQWILDSSEKASGIGSHFASSLELTPATEYVPEKDDAQASLFEAPVAVRTSPEQASNASGATAAVRATAPALESGATANAHCPSPFPSGF